MKKPLSEKKVLKKLKIHIFEQLGKGTVMRFASQINKMDPEVAKKALEQFPNFAAEVKDAITEYKDIAIKIISSGDDDHKELIKMITDEHTVLLSMLNNNLTVEEKLQILDRLDALQEKVAKENKEMRMYRMTVAGSALTIIGVGILALASSLGGNAEVSKNNTDNKN